MLLKCHGKLLVHAQSAQCTSATWCMERPWLVPPVSARIVITWEHKPAQCICASHLHHDIEMTPVSWMVFKR